MDYKTGALEGILVWYGQSSEVQFTRGRRDGGAEFFGNFRVQISVLYSRKFSDGIYFRTISYTASFVLKLIPY